MSGRTSRTVARDADGGCLEAFSSVPTQSYPAPTSFPYCLILMTGMVVFVYIRLLAELQHVGSVKLSNLIHAEALSMSSLF